MYITEKPEYFGSQPNRKLFGMLHSTGGEASWGAVFCHPLSEEKNASYRNFVELGRAFSEAGIPSLRFDCRGFGDSDGEMIDVDMETQASDVRLAMSRLAREYDLSKIVLFGARLGANVARLVAQSDKRVAALIMVAPIISGKRYWKNMLNEQRMSSLMRGIERDEVDSVLTRLDSDGFIEMKAENYNKKFVKQISGINLLKESNHFYGPHLLTACSGDKIARQETQHLGRLYENEGIELTHWLDESDEFWSDTSLTDSDRPKELYTKIIKWLQETGF